jgi:hypothetical protein
MIDAKPARRESHYASTARMADRIQTAALTLIVVGLISATVVLMARAI